MTVYNITCFMKKKEEEDEEEEEEEEEEKEEYCTITLIRLEISHTTQWW